MIANKIQKVRKKKHEGIHKFGSLIKQIHPDYTDLSDSLYLIMERLDDLRFVTLEDWMTDTVFKTDADELVSTKKRYKHIETELQGVVYELFWLLECFSVGKLLLKFAEHQTLVKKGLGPDTRSVHRGRKEEKKVKKFMGS
jgi:hypothetical protein